MVRFGRLVTFALFASAEALTYWVDESCNEFPAVDQADKEAVLMAKLSGQRMVGKDVEFRRAFERIFNAPFTHRPENHERRRANDSLPSNSIQHADLLRRSFPMGATARSAGRLGNDTQLSTAPG